MELSFNIWWTYRSMLRPNAPALVINRMDTESSTKYRAMNWNIGPMIWRNGASSPDFFASGASLVHVAVRIGAGGSIPHRKKQRGMPRFRSRGAATPSPKKAGSRNRARTG
jgi:hypothetical protein